ncbi:MAG: hypothetical protein AAB445_01480 [Patescibacteria group bacterium]
MPNPYAGTHDPRRTSIRFFGNCVEVNETMLNVKCREPGAPQFDYNGLRFESEDEVAIADLLTRQNINFRHHVRFNFRQPLYFADSAETVNVFSPDVLFGGLYLLEDDQRPHKHQWPIHGLELKASRVDARMRRICQQLAMEHNVHIRLLTHGEVTRYLKQWSIPLVPYPSPADLPLYQTIAQYAHGTQCA